MQQPDAPSALRALRDDGARPAALLGSWGGHGAVLAPEPALIRGVAPDGAPWLGLIGYPDEHPGDRRLVPEVIGGHPGDLMLGDTLGTTSGTRHAWHASWNPPDQSPHRRAVEACREAIRAGDVYQVNVCTRFEGRLDGDPLDMFCDIVTRTSPMKAAFLQGDWGAIMSFSPETFLAGRGRSIAEHPIKGTLPLTQAPEALRASVKDVAENVMIVDLVRNDLGRVAQVGSVHTPTLLRVDRAPGVWHLVSHVTAELRPEITREQLLDATFPPASVTGTPKISARERITTWERHTRGTYCGAIGIDHPATGLDLNVAIRTIECAPDGTLRLGVGGGITIDSDPDAEFAECMHKAASIVSVTSG
ncbi:aminodeoxychorismate synthase component I [Tsukamurella sp. 8F]|uniref:aminodeoxychorismate synthase component I n=1 Tax=unclassified Tsukamurella TaxID=2633480 RepID=UPI0023B8B07D|nr:MULTISPECIES: aminodeoxychorismate synthase component I [unclassified Tsukamurella]MDF0530271.1 aminodeoxychorismate synthase component I [Tsukamurella sp. 8J]MDF0588589.1 aminodeoxychorismate synthase component I [Tsukamurella sp. 8F]